MNNLKEIAEIFKALSDENRLKILIALKESEKCGCTLLEEIAIAQSTLSHHMKILTDSKLVESRKNGKWTYYSLSDTMHQCVESYLNDLLLKSDHYQCNVECK